MTPLNSTYNNAYNNNYASPLILVVEDDVNLLSGISDMLEGSGFQVLSAANGKAALEQLATTNALPNLIVSDVMMPKMDGYELLEAVRRERDWLEIPFIFLTAQTDDRQIRQGMVAGVDDYLTKPFTPENLIEAIRAKLYRQAQLTQSRAAQIRKVKADILNVLNHEFRTPLTPVVAYADLLTTDLSGMTREEVSTYVHGIQQGALRLRHLIEDFITLVELETGAARTQIEGRRSIINSLEGLFNMVLAQMEDHALASGVVIVTHLTEIQAFEADPEYVLDAVLRLLDNAVKFSDHRNSRVHLYAHTDSESVSICVADEGRGIPAERLEEIFDSFYQIDRDHYEDQGTGSGLAIVRGIMTLHGGQVLVESTVGQGSTFTLRFPVRTGRS